MADLDELARTSGFSGVVQNGDWRAAYGEADRANARPVDLHTRLAVASGNKGMTALAVMGLVEDGTLSLGTTARSLLGDDLPLIDDAVTVEHLLGHTSGIGDYLDEEAGGDIDDYVLKQPAYLLDTIEAFLPELEGHPQKFPPGARFSYCNQGFQVLALMASRASGVGFHDLVTKRVLEPAGMSSSGFFRTDHLPTNVALGYLQDGRTNVFHLPVRGTGDGGMYTTLADVETFWTSLFAGRILPVSAVTRMTAPRSDVPEEQMRYGLGFWLDPAGPGVRLTGYDAGASFMSRHDPTTGHTWTVISNSSEGAWPLARSLLS